MDTGGLIWTYFFLISVCTCTVSGSPIAFTVINCDEGGNFEFGPVDEGFSGDVELVTGITAGSNVKLVPYIFPDHLEFLELIFTFGETIATVRTKRPLDADVLIDSDTILYYSIICDGEIKSNNTRKLKITDLNDNSPVFINIPAIKTVSEAEPVNTKIFQVKAKDADITPAYNKVIYFMAPTSEDIMMTISGALILKRPLNYTLVQYYYFYVIATDIEGAIKITDMEINVRDPDNLNPYFIYSWYYAFIPENQVGHFYSIQPEAIKALPGNTGINTTLTYSIIVVDPVKYHPNFNIDSISGVVSVVTAMDFEEMDSSRVLVKVLAVEQVTGGLTAAWVSITILDVNDKAPQFPDIPDPLHISEEVYSEVRVQVEDVNEVPQFPPEVYKASIFSTDPYKTPVIGVKASDPDVGDEDQLEYSLVSGSPYFDVDASSGLVFVVSVVDLSGKTATVQVKVTDSEGLHATAKVEVEVQGSTSSSDVVTISLNQPANVVERKVPEMEKSLGKALGWTVNVIQVSNSSGGSPKSRTLREAAKSLVNFIAVDKVEVVSYEEVVRKLQSESAAVTVELTKVFGEGVQFAIEERPKDPDSDNLALTISLGVIVPVVIILVLIFVLQRTGSFRRFINFGKKPEDQTMRMDRQSNTEDSKKPEDQAMKMDSNSDDSNTSAL